MNISTLINYCELLNSENPSEYNGELNELLNKNISKLKEKVKIVFEDNFNFHLPKENLKCQYLYLNFYYLRLLIKELNENEKEILSFQQLKVLSNVFRNIVNIGIASHLLPVMPYHVVLQARNTDSEEIKYKMLIFTVHELYNCIKCNDLKPVIIINYFKFILSGLHQILYCPVKKPDKSEVKTGFKMTEEFYEEIMKNREIFQNIFDYFKNNIFTSIYIRETMFLSNEKSPKWLKSAVSATLNTIMRSPKGVENILRAMLDASGLDNMNDNTRTWKVVDIVCRIIVEARNLPDFTDNVCKQISELLDIKAKNDEQLYPFEQVFTSCVRNLYQIDGKLCFEGKLFDFLNFSKYESDQSVTRDIEKGIRILHTCFCYDKQNAKVLPTILLQKYISEIILIFVATLEQNDFVKLYEQVKNILLKYFGDLKTDKDRNHFLDCVIFDKHNNSQGKIQLKVINSNIFVDHVKNNDAQIQKILLSLFGDSFKFKKILFQYLLQFLSNTECSDEKLHTIFDLKKRKEIVLCLLCDLLQNEDDTKKLLVDNPDTVINYFSSLLNKIISSNVHKQNNCSSEEMNHVFGLCMVVQLLITNLNKDALKLCKSIVSNLEIIKNETGNQELANMANEILTVILDEKIISKEKDGKNSTPFDQALEDICDPLLPTRGHGLLTLAKLLENKEPTAMNKKQYLLNIFQQFLKDKDSFIYLNSIRGLAALGDIFPDTVLFVLCEEYISFDKTGGDNSQGYETQIKIGEVLVKITKSLGDKASNYKSLLLNTFMQLSKHDDYLLRASSLSNLGTVCQILSFNLGSIITEILGCVHDVLETDKAPEPRRAAVLVIRQLFVGLGKTTALTLKNEILEIYRTLKKIYREDEDQVTRLQAQVALEELNANMMEFLFPGRQLTTCTNKIEY